MFKGSGNAQGDLNGFLDAGSKMSGELRFEDTFRIDGRFDGQIDAAGDLIVGEGGEVDAEVTARRVFISGTVRGTVRALERLEITAIGKVYANLRTPSLTVEDGAFFEGSCSMESASAGAATSSEGAGSPKVTRMPAPGEARKTSGQSAGGKKA